MLSFKGLINKSLKSAWQSTWDAAVTNKLHSVKPVLGEWLLSFRINRREKVVLARCGIGHTRYTHFVPYNPIHSFIHCLVLVFWWVCPCPPLSICQFMFIVASGKSVSLLLHIMCAYFFMLFLCRRVILGRVLYWLISLVIIWNSLFSMDVCG